MGVLKVGFCALAVSQLDVENAAGQVELRRSRLHAHAIAYYVNANFERLVCPAHAGKLELQIHVLWIEQDGLSQGADRARSIPRVLVCGGSQLQGARVSILAWRSGSRVAARRGDAKAVSLSDHPPDTRSDWHQPEPQCSQGQSSALAGRLPGHACYHPWKQMPYPAKTRAAHSLVSAARRHGKALWPGRNRGLSAPK